MTPGEIGCALSHISLWKELAKNESEDRNSTIGASNGCIHNESDKEHAIQPDSLSMLIFEDDAAFLEQSHRRYTKKGYSKKVKQKQIQSAGAKPGDRFLKAFRTAHNILPGDWDIFYLGFSDRGERRDVISGRAAGDYEEEVDFVVQIFKPIYGFHTHAYAINQSASKTLLQNLPVVGPIDVWLADNQWFGLNVYCAIVANEGWKNTGAQLVGQDRSVVIASSVGHSGR
jgi:GR25 family glycosyltransferase involved in LPS biosynthesis